MEGKIYYAGVAMSETNSKPVFRGIRNTSGRNIYLTIGTGGAHGYDDRVSGDGVQGPLGVIADDNKCVWPRGT